MAATRCLALVLVAGLLAFRPPASADQRAALALERAGVPLAQAIETAERRSNGVAISAELAIRGGVFEVEVLNREGLIAVVLDAVSGDVRGSDLERVRSFLTGLDPAAVRQAPTSLAHAIGIAETQSGGRAIAAAVERQGDALRHRVQVVLPGSATRALTVDAATGAVVAEE